MLSDRRKGPARLAGGFSLIEMMVAMLIGAIVVVGAVSLIVAIDRSNSESVQATRLNQELRALAFVVADEIKRARRLHDPIAAVGQGAKSNGTFDFVDTSTASCIIYGYQDTPLSDAVANEDAVNNYESIYLKTTNGVGSIVFAKGTSAVGCTTAGTTLTSSQLNITGLTFSCVTLSGGNVSDVSTSTSALKATCNEIDMSISATLSSGDTYEKSLTRTYVQQVFIRSGAVKTS